MSLTVTVWCSSAGGIVPLRAGILNQQCAAGTSWSVRVSIIAARTISHGRPRPRRYHVRSPFMSMGNGSRSGVSSEINVTPMIDVLLVLLIIFMVVLPHHVWGERADIPVPSDRRAAPPPEPAVVIQLHDRGLGKAPGLTINRDAVAWPDLDTKLHEIFARRIERVAFLQGDPEIDFQYVADALDTAHHAGVDRVALLGAKD